MFIKGFRAGQQCSKVCEKNPFFCNHCIVRPSVVKKLELIYQEDV